MRVQPTATTSVSLVRGTKGISVYLYGHLHADGNHPSVKFSSNYADVRLPDPKLLALHAACARVVHMSGVTEPGTSWSAISKTQMTLPAPGRPLTCSTIP